ncbi:MAG: proline dehydrogenase family protein [Thermoanaerobaculia bacterium]|nr:proline dehydrogenase family protein [Thermoanaerobaculia bacterium]
MSLFTSILVRTLPLMPKFLVWRVAKRYVAGNDLDAAAKTVRGLNELGAMATIDVLGEGVIDQEQALGYVEEYARVFDRIAADGLDANVSVKPTMLLLNQDEMFCRDCLDILASNARSIDNFLRIDMEDASTTDATLRIYWDLQAKHGCVGTVLQAYMRRTLDDIASLPEQRANIRLCKGIYIESRRVAWKGYETVRANFVAALEKLLTQGVYAAIATHDEYLVARACALIERLQIPRDRYEFQMLLGVDEELRDILIEQGHRIRIYVPYGQDWYQYSLRRLRENPEIAGHVARSFLGLK